MPRPSSSQPTAVELQILRALWQHGPSTVRRIHEAVSADKQTRYSTTVKMLSIMLDKGLVKRDERQRPHVYRAAVTQQRTQQQMLADLIQRVYNGSAKSLVLQALSSAPTSEEDLEEVRRLIDRLRHEK